MGHSLVGCELQFLILTYLFDLMPKLDRDRAEPEGKLAYGELSDVTSQIEAANQQAQEGQQLVWKLPSRASLSTILAIIIVVLCLGLAVIYSNYKGSEDRLQSMQTKLNAVQQQLNNMRPYNLRYDSQGSHQLSHKHNHFLKSTFSYPTVGVPEPGKTFNSTPVAREDLANFDDQVNQLFKPYNDTDCEMVRIGSQHDGGYLLCANYFSKAEALLNFGIEWNDEFGCSLSQRLMIPNYQYDCTVSAPPKCKFSNGLSVFSPVCTGDASQVGQKFTYSTLWDVLKNRNLVKKHIILKIDTEGGEYPAFRFFPLEFLDYVDQIAIEIHLGHITPEVWGNLDIMKTLMEKFVPVNYHMNNFACLKHFPEEQPYRLVPSLAFEATLVNKKLIKLNSQSRSFSSHPLNSRDWPEPNAADCQHQP